MGRKEILDLLAERPGEYISGESISKRLNLTRAAVWKQVKALKDSGYQIEGVTKSGYRLLGTPLDLDQWVLEQELRTQVLGKDLRLFAELPSTNDWAKEAIQKGDGGHGLTVIAKKQNLGRGRQRRHWESPQGGLWMSVILQPNLSLADAAKLTLSASVAVIEGIKDAVGVEAGIKWPNDILYQEHKLAGILGEVAGEWNAVQSIVLGIGINANLERVQLGEGIPAETLRGILGQEVNLNRLAARVLEHLERELQDLELRGFSYGRERWLSKALGLGEEVLVRRGNESWNGVFRGINGAGELLLETGEKMLNFSAGEVQLRSRTGKYFRPSPS
ncbi:MAG: biotin--[acetyl-CoA-carboxylase] ligase [Desulfitobacteriaceae bacterium]